MNAEYLPPQIKEVYDSLIKAGKFENAQHLLDEHSHASSETVDYLTTKRKTVYNLWVHQVARSLEENMCQRAAMPCSSCVAQARDIGFRLWSLIFKFLHDLRPRYWGTPWEMLEAFHKVLENKETPLLPPVAQVATPRIVKAPIPEVKDVTRNRS